MYKICKCGNSFFSAKTSQRLCISCQKKLETELLEVKPLEITPKYNKKFIDFLYEKNRKIYDKLQAQGNF